MPKRPAKGKAATFGHAKVVYSPFRAGAGAQFVLTADPWSYLTATINQKLSRGPRGENRIRLERALYYANLAEAFYASAKSAALPISGTLAYYGILNLVKCFLSVNGVTLETTIEHHGLSLAFGKPQTIQISRASTGALSIFHEFSRLLGKPVLGKGEASLKEIAAHIPELHEMAFTLGHLPGSKRGFLPIEIHFLTSAADNRLFTEVRYEKKQISRVDTAKFLKDERASYFRNAVDEDGHMNHRSKQQKRCDWNSLPRAYHRICEEYAAFDIASLLTPAGYKFYCDLGKPSLHHLAYSLMVMFYIGTAARYRPSEMKDLLDSDLRPLVSEALAVVPGQMLYQLVSLCTARTCVVPHAAIAS